VGSEHMTLTGGPRRRDRVGARLSHYSPWIACCLSRGLRAPLGERDVDDLAAEFGETQACLASPMPIATGANSVQQSGPANAVGRSASMRPG